MDVFRGICLRDHEVRATNGDCLSLVRGKEYTISAEKDGKVVVFSSFWVPVPADLFGGVEPLVAREGATERRRGNERSDFLLRD
jgi:hypothetical protein